MTIPDLGSDLPGVVLRTAIVYVCLVLGFRFLGKREAGQLSTLDLVVLLVIANAVQNAMVGENTSLIAGLVAAAVILLLDLVLHAAADRWEPLRNALDGEPTILVDHGRILSDNLRREGISDRELAVALRQNLLMSPEEALYVFLETNGQISVIPRRDDDDDDGPPDVDGESQDPAADTGSRRGIFRRRSRRPGRLSGGSG
ncbi:MAG TPA: YetF domain-containing protein [Candidatus Limnocylindrales bacterium]|nr:YetF domain-containing protein [Candidatus Limnocylindrales bacterium]